MVDPEGNTYERTAIESWLSTNQTSPITRSFLAPSMLNPNRALRDAIQQFRQMRGDTDMAEPPRAPSGQLAAPPPEPEIPEEPITLSAKPVSLPGGSAGVEISVEPPDGTTTRPMDIVAVVARSYLHEDQPELQQGLRGLAQRGGGHAGLVPPPHGLRHVLVGLQYPRVRLVGKLNKGKLIEVGVQPDLSGHLGRHVGGSGVLLDPENLEG